jgi:hypothetical protein
LRRYLGATRQNVAQALQLYEYKIALSEALYGLLHGLEVAVRNAAHHALTASFGTPTWYDIAPLSGYWVDQLGKAKQKPGVGAVPGKVVAELTFGFWVDLLQGGNHRSVWVDRKLNKAFPNARRHRKLFGSVTPAFANTTSRRPFSCWICANSLSRSAMLDASARTAVAFSPMVFTASSSSG